MSWVKESLQRGKENRDREVERKRAEELARLADISDKEKARLDAKNQLERDQQEEIARYKHLLDERGVPELLEEVRAELGGVVIFKSKPRERQENGMWVAYGLVNSGQGWKEKNRHGGGGNRTEWEYPQNQDGSYGDTRLPRTLYGDRFSRSTTLNIPVSKIVVGVESSYVYLGHRSPDRFYLSARNGVAQIEKIDEFSGGGEIPLLLRFLPRIPGLINQRTVLRRGGAYEIIHNLALGPDGRVDPDSFDLSHNSSSKRNVDLTDNPSHDRGRIQEELSIAIGSMA